MELLFVHLTDMHIREDDDMDILIPRAETIGKTICTHVTEPEVSMIIYCLTGDFSYSGKEDEFVLAELFIETIIEELKKRFPEVPYKIICVPGNHDCDFTDENCELRRAILESKRLNIKDIKQMQVCTGIQKNYFAFVQRLDAISCSPDSIMTADKVSMGDNGDLSLVFHCINTSWCSDIHEQKGKMKFYFDELPEKTQNEIVFTLMHHDAEWLDWEDNEKWEEYQIRYSDVIMIGHDHSAKFTIMQNYDDSTKYYIKGNQLYDSMNPSQSGFNILKLNTNRLSES